MTMKQALYVGVAVIAVAMTTPPMSSLSMRTGPSGPEAGVWVGAGSVVTLGAQQASSAAGTRFAPGSWSRTTRGGTWCPTFRRSGTRCGCAATT